MMTWELEIDLCVRRMSSLDALSGIGFHLIYFYYISALP